MRRETAADWLARRDRGFTPAEQDQFLQWLASDPRHGEWFALHRSVTGDLNALLQWRPDHSNDPNPDLLARPPRLRPWPIAVGLGLAAIAVLALIPLLPLPDPDPDDNFAYERRVLEDGTSVELNRGTILAVNYSPTERRAVLSQGEAMFAVKRDLVRPFTVTAGDVSVLAVGTEFSVRLVDSVVEVLVTEGRVAVDPGNASVPSGAANGGIDAKSDGALALVDAGHRATVVMHSTTMPRIEAVTEEEIARSLAWQPQMLDFSAVPLRLALEEFNRRNRVQFVLVDPEIGELPIVASLRSDNTEGFARFLERSPGIEVERRGDREIILRRRP